MSGGRIKFYLSNDVKTWHEILEHFNINDVLNLPSVVEGIKITGKFTNNRKQETCVQTDR